MRFPSVEHASAVVQIHTAFGFLPRLLLRAVSWQLLLTECRRFNPACASAYSSVVEHSTAARPYLRTMFSRITTVCPGVPAIPSRAKSLAASVKQRSIMAKFSILNPLSCSKSVPNTVNLEGGRAFTQTAKLELVSVLLTTLLDGRVLSDGETDHEKIRELIAKTVDPRFVAKAAL